MAQFLEEPIFVATMYIYTFGPQVPMKNEGFRPSIYGSEPLKMKVLGGTMVFYGKFPLLFPYTTPIFESLKDMGSAPMGSRFTRPFLRRLSWDPTSASEAVAAGSRFLGSMFYMAITIPKKVG